MPDRLRQIFQRFLDFWNRYNRRQKAIVLSSLAVVLLTLGILVAVLSRPQYEHLTNCSNYNEMSQITTLLTDNGYAYQLNESTMVISVKKQDLVNAKMLLATNNIKTTDYTWEDYFNNASGLSTTEGDKLIMYQTAKTSDLTSALEGFDFVDEARVNLYLANSSDSLFNKTEGSSVSVALSLNTEIDDMVAENLAYFIKNSVQNLALKDITIMTMSGENLYSGDANSNSASYPTLSRQLKYTQQVNDVVGNTIKNQVLSAGIYSDVKVVVNYDVEWSNFEKVLHEYSVPEGNEQGYLSHSYIEKSTGGSTVGGVPGTESNDEDTTYEIQDGTTNNSTYSLEQYDYLPSELVTTETTSPGEIIKDTSTVSAVFTKNIVYREEEAKALGYLDDMSWDEFKASNGQTVAIEFDDTWIDIIASGSGVPRDNITVAAYEKHFFYDKETNTRPFSFYLQILLALAILGLLAFVVFRSSKPVTVEETEPELSVEEMLATTKEARQSVEDIDLQEKSEVRKAIEKFVDENPEAVALLLRNWLDDGWD